jgi:hypothetical protein
VPPFAVKYSRHKRDGKLMAVSDEDGFVTLLDHGNEVHRDDRSFQQLAQEGAPNFSAFGTGNIL